MALGKLFLAILLMALASYACGLGASGEDADPGLSIRAQVTDVSGVSTTIDEAKADGRASLSGMLGNALVTVPFAKISYIEFIAKGQDLSASVHAANGQRLTLQVKRTTQLVGYANFGKYRINLGQISHIRFLP